MEEGKCTLLCHMATDFVAGLIGGFAGVLTGHPFDTVKVRLQAQDGIHPKYRGSFHCVSSIIRQESVFGLFKGMASPMVSLTFINALVFGVQANVMRLFDKPTLFSHWASGATAGAVQSVIAGPMELAKIRMQMEGIGEMEKCKYKNYTGSISALQKIYKTEGTRGLYRGFTVTLLRDSPAFGVYFVTYEAMCRQFAKLNKYGYVGIGQLLVAGGVGGMSSWCSTYAFDVIKTRLQADGVNGVSKYSGILDAFKVSFREEGFRVFYKGLGVTLLRAFPVNATTFTVVAVSLRVLNTDEDQECHGSVAAMSKRSVVAAQEKKS